MTAVEREEKKRKQKPMANVRHEYSKQSPKSAFFILKFRFVVQLRLDKYTFGHNSLSTNSKLELLLLRNKLRE